MKRLKYCRNYELPLFDQEQCYQFVIIDLCRLNFLLIAIYIWINGASKISGFTPVIWIFANWKTLFLYFLYVALTTDCCILNLRRGKVKYEHIFFISLSSPDCSALAWPWPGMPRLAWEPPAPVTRCQCVIIFNNYPNITRGSAR